MSPKKLLRLPEAKSSFDEMIEGNNYWNSYLVFDITNLRLSQISKARQSR